MEVDVAPALVRSARVAQHHTQFSKYTHINKEGVVAPALVKVSGTLCHNTVKPIRILAVERGVAHETLIVL